jgi:hypothetical protein
VDTVTLVSEQVRDGDRLLDRLAHEGVRVRAAGWVKPADEDRWSLYVVTPLVDERGPIGAYREVYRVLRSLEDVRVKDYEVKLVGEGHRVAGDLLEAQPRDHARAPQRGRLTSVGGMPVEEVYVYPPARPKTTGPKQSVLRFVLRSADHPMAVMSRFHPQGKVVLNRTEWRGKGPRSCGVVSIKGRPHAAGSPEPAVFDVEVAYRPKGCVTYTGGTRYDGWAALVLDRESGTRTDGFGTMIVNVNNSTPQLRQVLLDQVTELMAGFVEGRYSVKNMSNDEFVFAELNDVLVDCTPNEEGKGSRFNCLGEYLPDSYLDELAMRLASTYEVDVSVVEGPRIGLLLRRVEPVPV